MYDMACYHLRDLRSLKAVNMKCVQWSLALAALALAAPSAPAQTPTKVGIINVQGAILATKDGEKARDAIRARFEPRAKDMEGRMAEVNRLKDQFSKGANTMSADAREKLSREIDDKQKKYQWDSEDMQNELQQEEQKLVNEIGQRMISIIDEFAKANTFAVVFDVSGQQSPVLWAANGIDVTTQIVELYDKKFGTGGGAAATTAAPAAAKPAATTPARPAAAAPKKP
jgi:outer membrane protein